MIVSTCARSGAPRACVPMLALDQECGNQCEPTGCCRSRCGSMCPYSSMQAKYVIGGSSGYAKARAGARASERGQGQRSLRLRRNRRSCRLTVSNTPWQRLLEATRPTLSARRYGWLRRPGPGEVGERPGARRRAPTNDSPPLSGGVAASAGQRPGGGPAGGAGQRVVRGAGATPPTGKSR